MTRLNNKISLEKERELINKLYHYLEHDHDADLIENDIEYDYLTCNTGRDKKDYFWYLDENNSVAIDMDGNIIDEEKNIEKLFY